MVQKEYLVQQEEPYFYSPFKEYTDITIYGADTSREGGLPLGKNESLNREEVLCRMMPNAVCVHDAYGRIWVNHPYGDMPIDDDGTVHDSGIESIDLFLTRDGEKRVYGKARKSGDNRWLLDHDAFDSEAVGFIEGGYIVPASPWGRKFSLIYMDLSSHTHPSLVDQPDNLLRKTMAIQSQIIRYRLDNTGYKPVYWGQNNSIGLRYGRGLMSVLYPHEQIWQFRDDMSGLRPNHIRMVRNHVRWDDGISQRIANDILPEFSDSLRQYKEGKNFNIVEPQSDRMGFTIELPGFTPEDLGDPDFIDKFWRPLSLKIHDHLGRFQSLYYGSDFYDYCRLMLENHRANRKVQPEHTDEELNSFFTLRDIDQIQADPNEIRVVLDLIKNDRLNKPPGWAGGIQFTREGAFVTITLGFLAEKMGPAQGMGIDLQRRHDQKISPDEEDQIVRKMQVLQQNIQFTDALYQEYLSLNTA